MSKLSASILLCHLFIFGGVFSQNPNPLQYEIWVTLDDEQRMLTGREQITWQNTSNDVIGEMYFHLYWNAFKNEKSTLQQEAAASSFGGNRSGQLSNAGHAGYIDIKKIQTAEGIDLSDAVRYVSVDQPDNPHDQTVMRIDLPQALNPGQSITLDLEFESKIPRTIARSGYYQDSYFIGQWFPKPGVYEEGRGWNCHHYHYTSEFYADFASFKVHITVPDRFVVGASGSLTDSTANAADTMATFTYSEDHIHDFAWTAAPQYIKVSRDFIPEQVIDPEEYQRYTKIFDLPLADIRLDTIRMVLLINPGHRHQIDRHFGALIQAIKYYGLWYGKYPYPTITMVDPPFRTRSSGMEYPTLFTAGTSIITSKRHSPESVIVHEYGHNYWQGMVASNEFEAAWLDEGINTYSEGKVLAQAFGPDVLPLRIARIPVSRYIDRFSYPGYAMERAIGLHITETDPVLRYSWKFYSPVSYGLNVYFRAATLLYTLENILGEETMLRVLRRFQQQYRFRHPYTADFIAVVNEVSGANYRWFFDELFFTARQFDYAIADVRSEKIRTARGFFDTDSGRIKIDRKKARAIDAEKDTTLYETTVKVRRLGEARIGGSYRLPVKMVFENDSVITRYWNGQDRWHIFRLTTASKIRYAHIDPETKFLIDANITNNSMRAESKSDGLLRVSNKFLFWIQNLLQMITLIG